MPFLEAASRGRGGHLLPMLRIAAAECGGFALRLGAYVGALAVIALAGLHLFERIGLAAGAEGQAQRPVWTEAARSYPAFAVTQSDFSGATESYAIYRHPDGGRRDVLRWTMPVRDKPLRAELELHRFGEAGDTDGPAQLAARIGVSEGRMEAAGFIASKFGGVALYRVQADAASCLVFLREWDLPRLQLSGWSCSADPAPVQKRAIACLLSRLVLLTAGGDGALAELFARAELHRRPCPASGSAGGDWVMGLDDPALRGRL